MSLTSIIYLMNSRLSFYLKRIFGKSFLVCFVLMIFIFYLDFLQMKSFSRTLLKGGITTIVRKGENLELNIHTPLNLYYSQIGDKVAGFISHDIPVSEDFLIPKGSKAEGILTAIKKPKKFGQDGAFEISFNELILPDGTLIEGFAGNLSGVLSGALPKGLAGIFG